MSKCNQTSGYIRNTKHNNICNIFAYHIIGYRKSTTFTTQNNLRLIAFPGRHPSLFTLCVLALNAVTQPIRYGHMPLVTAK